jgi:hypothetical protein
MYNVEKEIRQMIANITKDYNEQLLRFICEKFNLDTDTILPKYAIPYYYMPVIEREIKKLTIE